jgi:hypothetical protein
VPRSAIAFFAAADFGAAFFFATIDLFLLLLITLTIPTQPTRRFAATVMLPEGHVSLALLVV